MIRSREEFSREEEKRREREVWMGVLRGEVSDADWARAALMCGKAKPEGFDWTDMIADVQDGADVKAKRSDLLISLRARRIDDRFHPRYADEITITSSRDYQDGRPRRTEIDKVREGRCDIGLYGWHRPEEGASMWVMFCYHRLRDPLLQAWGGIREIKNVSGRGGGVCRFKPIPISLLREAKSVVAHSDGHPAFGERGK